MNEKADGSYWRHQCERCGYIWYSKMELPKNCNTQKCNSPYWNQPRAVKAD